MRSLIASLLLVSFTALHAESPAPPPLPVQVASFGATALPNGDVLTYGGHSGARHKYNREDVHGTLHRWTPGAAAWEKLGEGEPAQGASLVATDKGVIRIGGMAARNEKGAKQDLWSSETATLFDLDTKSWRELPKLPQRRSSHDSTLVGNTLYVMGGWAMLGSDGVKWHDTYLTLDLSQPDAQWQTHSQPFKRRGLAAQGFGTKVYAIGGMDSDEDLTSAVDVLDTKTGQWSEGPALPKERLGGFGFASVVHEGRFFANGVTGVLLELREGAWVAIAKLQHPRFFHRLVPGGKGRLIALGGESRDRQKPPPESIVLPPPDSPALSDAGTPTTAGADWPRYQGPRGDSTTPATGWSKDWPANGPPVLWKAEVGVGLASFAVAENRAYTAGNDGADRDTLWCLDLDKGTPLWKHTFATPTRCHEMPIVPGGPAATPTVVSDKAWFISRDGDVLCLNSQTGAVLWQKHLVRDLGGKRPVYGYSNSPCVVDGRLYLDVGGNGKSNACLDAASGDVIWQTGEGEAGYATPYLIDHDGKKVLVIFKGQGLELRAAADGKLLARHAMETRDYCNCATPVQWQDTFFVSHTGGEGSRALQWKDDALTERWHERGLGLLFHSGVRVQNRLLVFNDGMRGANELRLMDLATGKTLWTDTTIERGTALVTDDGHALLLTNKGELVLAKVLEDRLDVLQRVQVLPAKCWVQPALAHGRLICKNNEGAVVCLDLR